MLAFSINRPILRRQKEEARERSQPLSHFFEEEVTAPTSRGTLHPTPADQAQASLFQRIFKAEVSGIEVPHSRSEFAQHLSRYGALGYTSPALRKWLQEWMKLGGIAVV